MYEQNTDIHGANLLAVCLSLQLCVLKNLSVMHAAVRSIAVYFGVPHQSVYSALLTVLFVLTVILLSFLLPMLLFFRLRHKKITCYIRLRPELPLYPFFTIIFTAAAAVLTLLFIDTVAETGHLLTPLRVRIPEGAFEITFFFICRVLIPALAIEILFRGIVLNELMPWGRTFAIAAAAFTGALLSDSPSMFLFQAVIGLISGYFVCHTNSLWMGVFISLVSNLIYFLDCFLYSTALSMQYGALIEITVAVLFVAGIFSCIKIDEQIRSNKIHPIPYDRNQHSVFQCLLAPCAVAYYIIILINIG